MRWLSLGLAALCCLAFALGAPFKFQRHFAADWLMDRRELIRDRIAASIPNPPARQAIVQEIYKGLDLTAPRLIGYAPRGIGTYNDFDFIGPFMSPQTGLVCVRIRVTRSQDSWVMGEPSVVDLASPVGPDCFHDADQVRAAFVKRGLSGQEASSALTYETLGLRGISKRIVSGYVLSQPPQRYVAHFAKSNFAWRLESLTVQPIER